MGWGKHTWLGALVVEVNRVGWGALFVNLKQIVGGVPHVNLKQMGRGFCLSTSSRLEENSAGWVQAGVQTVVLEVSS